MHIFRKVNWAAAKVIIWVGVLLRSVIGMIANRGVSMPFYFCYSKCIESVSCAERWYTIGRAHSGSRYIGRSNIDAWTIFQSRGLPANGLHGFGAHSWGNCIFAAGNCETASAVVGQAGECKKSQTTLNIYIGL